MQGSQADRMNRLLMVIKKIGNIWFAFILWLLCSIPVITLGASTTALLFTDMQMIRGKGTVKENFIKSFKENLLMSTIFFLVYGIIGLLIGFGFRYGYSETAEYPTLARIFVWIVSVPYVLSVTFLFAVQARFSNTIRDAVMYSLGMPVRNFVYTLQMVLLIGGFTYLNVWLVNEGMILGLVISVSAGMPLLVYILAAYFNRIFINYIPEELLTEKENGIIAHIKKKRQNKMIENKKKAETEQVRHTRKSMAEIISASSNDAEE